MHYFDSQSGIITLLSMNPLEEFNDNVGAPFYVIRKLISMTIKLSLAVVPAAL